MYLVEENFYKDLKLHLKIISKKVYKWRKRNKYFYKLIASLLNRYIKENDIVIELGSGSGFLLSQLNGDKIGIEISKELIELANNNYPNIKFIHSRVEDFKIPKNVNIVIAENLLHDIYDIQILFDNVYKDISPDSRFIVTFWNILWMPIVKLAEKLLIKQPSYKMSWIGTSDIRNFAEISGFEIITLGSEVLFPFEIPIISNLLNRFIVKLPIFKDIAFQQYVIMRKVVPIKTPQKISIIVPTRNEKGNIEDIFNRIQKIGHETEVIFVDGASNDGTVEEIEFWMKKTFPFSTKLIHQTKDIDNSKKKSGKMLKLGKADAVKKGFAASTGNILMILDSDISVAPEDLKKFYNVIISGKAEFANGSRLIYPLENEAMRFLNIIGNKFFALLFSWILDQNIKDTLCGTKVFTRDSYERILSNKKYFGDFDPFGDFELIFGAARSGLAIKDIPVRYYARKYGNIKIERFKHGLILIRMSWFGLINLKFNKI